MKQFRKLLFKQNLSSSNDSVKVSSSFQFLEKKIQKTFGAGILPVTSNCFHYYSTWFQISAFSILSLSGPPLTISYEPRHTQRERERMKQIQIYFRYISFKISFYLSFFLTLSRSHFTQVWWLYGRREETIEWFFYFLFFYLLLTPTPTPIHTHTHTQWTGKTKLTKNIVIAIGWLKQYQWLIW